MSPHGTPDWWGTGPKSTTYALQDLAELAVRLGSVINHDRRGDVVWMDDWKDGLGRLLTETDGVGGDVYLQATGGKYRGSVLIMNTGNLIADWATITVQSYFPVPGGIGTEVAFAIPLVLADAGIIIYLFQGVTVQIFTARYNHVLGTIEIGNDALDWVVVGTPGIQHIHNMAFCDLKLVVDTAALRYRRVLFNRFTYDASKYTPAVSASVVPPMLSVQVRVSTSANASAAVPVAHMIITQNEPL